MCNSPGAFHREAFSVGHTWTRVRHPVSAVLLMLALVAASLQAGTNDTSGTRATVSVDADPINFATGEYTLRETLADLGGPLPLDFQFYYGSVRNTRRRPDGLPFKFAHNLHGYLVHDLARDQIALEPGMADEISFSKVGGDWRVGGNEAVALQLIESGEYYHVADPVAEIVSIYHRSATNGVEVTATLRARLDRNGNRLIYTPSADPAVPGPVGVSDGRGRALTLTYAAVGIADTNPYLTQVTDHGGRSWRLVYEENPPDAPGRITLRMLVDAAGHTNHFHYATNGFHFLHRVTRPRGNTPSRQTYRATRPEDAFRGMVTRQTDARSNRWDIQAEISAPAEDPRSRFTLIQPDGTTRGFLHDHGGRVTRRFLDEEGRALEYRSEPVRDVFTALVDRRGHRTHVTHHPSGRIASVVDALGRRTGFTYLTRTQMVTNPFNLEAIPCVFHDLVRVDHPDGTFEEYSHDERGNVLVSRDAAGALTRQAYDGSGLPVARTNALGGVTTFTYDAAGNLQSVTDSDGVVQRFGYDALFRLTSVTNSDGSVLRHERDALNLLTGLVDELGVRTEFRYDANRNLIQVIRAAGTAVAQTNQLDYDDLDRLVRLVDPAGLATHFAHTHRGALAEATWADGSRVRIGYDRRHFPVELTDEAGRVLRAQRDAEGLPTVLLTPAGRRIKANYDPQGFPTEVFDGLTNRFLLAYDANQRLTNVVDRLGRSLAISRDGAGRTTALRLPVVGTVRYDLNGLGQITNLTDFRRSQWRFDYTTMGRLARVRDPLSNVWSFAYDGRGRLAEVVHPDGLRETNRYDLASSLVGRHFSDGLKLDFGRDALRRLTDTASVPVALAYDRRNLPVASTMHGRTMAATFDDRRRLATLDYDGITTLAYTYDARGLVTRVRDSRTGVFVEFEYDDDRFLRRVNRSNGVKTRYERDANGLVTRIDHEGKADLRLGRNAGGEIVGLSAAGLAGLAAFLPDESLSFTYDLASQPVAAGFAHDARGRRVRDPQRAYAWDAADRLAAVTNGPAVVLQEFTARGDVAVETVDGVVTEFFYHDAVGGRPLLMERRGGEYRRYYVFTPGGGLLFAVDLPSNRPSFHHFNHAGTTVFLTGPDGAVTDTYGYTPYGRPVRHEGTSDQPFTFNGEFGVRQIAGSAVFHMRARFYDSLTARFLTRDPSWLGLLQQPGDLNPYGFARQNPLSYADPLGRQAAALFVDGDPFSGRVEDQPIGTVVQEVDASGNSRALLVVPGGEENGFRPQLVAVDSGAPFQCRSTPAHPPAEAARPGLDEPLLTRPSLEKPRPLQNLIPNNVPAVADFLSRVESPVAKPARRGPDRGASGSGLQLAFARDRADLGVNRGDSCASFGDGCAGTAEQNFNSLQQRGGFRTFSLLNPMPGTAGAWVPRLLPLVGLGALWLGVRVVVRRRGPRQ